MLEESSRSEAGTKEQPAGWVLVNLRIFVGLAGVVACYAWLFLALGTSAFFPDTANGLVMGGGHVLLLLGACAAFLVIWLFSDWFQARKALQCTVSGVVTALGVVGLWAANGSGGGVPVLWVSSFLMGMGFGFLYPLYGEFICWFFYEYIKPYIHGIFAVAVLVSCGVLFTGVERALPFATLFPVAALACYAVELVVLRLGDKAQIGSRESDKRNRIVWRSYLSTITSGMASGFAVGVLLCTQSVQSWPYALAGGCLVVTCALLLVDSLGKNRVNETITMRFFLPFSALVVFPLIFVPDSAKFVFALLLLCASLLPTTCSISAVCKHIVICDLSALRAFSIGRFMSFVGIALGVALALAGFTDALGGMLGDVAPVAAVVAFMLLVIFSASFVMTEDNYPDEERFRAAVKEGDASGASALAGTPIRPINAAKADAESDELAPPVQRPSVFYAKCDVVAERYGLSKRQREVLVMLAKGRNADYITEKLVISPHTAKAHIYNVYQKVGVHSRPELMDLVESAEIEGVDEG